jgi:hypothetical protein
LFIFHRSVDILEKIEENCLKYLLNTIDFDSFTDSQMLMLPYVDLFITSKKKPKVQNRSKKKMDFHLRMSLVKRNSVGGKISPESQKSPQSGRSSKKLENLNNLDKLLKEYDKNNPIPEEIDSNTTHTDNSEKRLSKKLETLKNLNILEEKRKSKKLAPLIRHSVQIDVKNLEMGTVGSPEINLTDIEDKQELSSPRLTKSKSFKTSENSESKSSRILGISQSSLNLSEKKNRKSGFFGNVLNAANQSARKSLNVNIFQKKHKSSNENVSIDDILKQNSTEICSPGFVEFCFYTLELYLDPFHVTEWNMCENFYQKQADNTVNFMCAIDKELLAPTELSE